MRVSVIGLGYVGLTAAVCFAEKGWNVSGQDWDIAKIHRLRAADLRLYEPALGSFFEKNLRDGRLHFHETLEPAVNEADVVLIAIGVREGDLESQRKLILRLVRDLRPLLRKDAVLVLKSTCPVGTAREVATLLQGAPVETVVNPEFLRTGCAVADFLNPRRIVVGAQSPRSFERMRTLYRPFLGEGILPIETDYETAELSKLAANSFLAARLGFMQEMSRLSDSLGADFHVLRGILGADPRIGPSYLHPGLGFGGPCLPQSLKGLENAAERTGSSIPLIRAVSRTNEEQKWRALSKIFDRLPGDAAGRTVSFWGFAFKEGTDDARGSVPVFLIEELAKKGIRVQIHDPAATCEFSQGVVRFLDPFQAARDAEVLVIAADWPEYRSPEAAFFLSQRDPRTVLDFRHNPSDNCSLTESARA